MSSIWAGRFRPDASWPGQSVADSLLIRTPGSTHLSRCSDRVKLRLGGLALDRGLDEAREQRVRQAGPRLELWMELAAHEVRMLRQLDHLDQAPVRRHARQHHAVALER